MEAAEVFRWLAVSWLIELGLFIHAYRIHQEGKHK